MPTSEKQYVGCFRDAGDRTLPKLLGVGDMNADKCSKLAVKAGLKYFGTQYSSECWGGNDLKAAAKLGTAGNCNMKCSGANGTDEKCGGSWANSVYMMLQVPDPPAAQKGHAYVGCFRDSYTRMLPTVLSADDKCMSNEKCGILAELNGFKYYSTQAGSWCFGGNDLAQAKSLGPSVSCITHCAGDGGQNCGGPWANSVFEVKEPVLNAKGVEMPEGYLGCYRDSGNRMLPKLLGMDKAMTAEKCSNLAAKAGLKYYGTQYSSECWGGNDLARAQSLGKTADCKMACSGKSTEICGGPWANSVYELSDDLLKFTNDAKLSAPKPKGYLGCYKDSPHRVLPRLLAADSHMTTERCSTLAVKTGYEYFGTEYSGECFAGNDLAKATSLGKSDQCNMKCHGNAGEICGGPWALSVYEAPEKVAKAALKAKGYLGCFKDSGNRMLPKLLAADSHMTTERCSQLAAKAGLKFYGTEYSGECFAGNDLARATSLGDSDQCNMKCHGDAKQICGGPWALSVYRTPPNALKAAASKHAGYVPLGCYKDSSSRVLPKMLAADNSMTTEKCAQLAADAGMKYFGTEYSRECFGGNDLAKAKSLGKSDHCTMKCNGHAGQTCGGPWALSVYETPSVANEVDAPMQFLWSQLDSETLAADDAAATVAYRFALADAADDGAAADADESLAADGGADAEGLVLAEGDASGVHAAHDSAALAVC